MFSDPTRRELDVFRELRATWSDEERRAVTVRRHAYIRAQLGFEVVDPKLLDSVHVTTPHSPCRGWAFAPARSGPTERLATPARPDHPTKRSVCFQPAIVP